MCQQPLMKVSHLIRQRRRNTDKKYESRIGNYLERKNDHNNKSKECLSLRVTRSSDDSIELQMNQLQQEHHNRRSSISHNIVQQRSEFINHHLCSSKQEKSQLFQERKSLKKARKKRRMGRFFNEIKSKIRDETHSMVQRHQRRNSHKEFN